MTICEYCISLIQADFFHHEYSLPTPFWVIFSIECITVSWDSDIPPPKKKTISRLGLLMSLIECMWGLYKVDCSRLFFHRQSSPCGSAIWRGFHTFSLHWVSDLIFGHFHYNAYFTAWFSMVGDSVGNSSSISVYQVFGLDRKFCSNYFWLIFFAKRNEGKKGGGVYFEYPLL